MTVSSLLVRLRWLSAITLVSLLATPVWAQYRPPQAPVGPHRMVAPNGYTNPVFPAPNRYVPATQPGARRRPFRTAQRPDSPAYLDRLKNLNNTNAETAPTLGTTAAQGEHPLAPALRWAHDGLNNIKKIQDYSATVVKRERLGNTVGGYQYMFLKIRHNPFSVYTRFLAPDKLKGQECIYIKGQNNGKMFAHGTGLEKKLFKTVLIAPDGPIAMRGQRYPLTEIGMLNLVTRLIEVGEEDMKYGECDVKFFKGAKINNRVCTVIQVVHPVPRRNFRFHLARIFIDDELNVPIRYEAFDWPKEQGSQPQLLEEYTYLDLKLNQGFTDEDFTTDNPNYDFP